MKSKKLVYIGLIMLLTLTACGKKEETSNVKEETVVETEIESEVIEEVVTEEEATVVETEEEQEEIIPYGEENGFEYTTETSFNLPWAFSFANSEMNAPQDYSGMSVTQYDAITEFKSVKYKDEGDLRTVELVIKNTCSYQLKHEFAGDVGRFYYIFSFTPLHPGDMYTGTLFGLENTSDIVNYYDKTTTLDLGNRTVDVRIEKIEDNVSNKGDWKWNDEWSEIQDNSATKTYTYKLTYPKDYDGVVFCLEKDGATEIFWEYQEEAINEAESILSDCTVDELIFVRVEDLIASKGEEVEEIVNMEEKVEEIRVREEEKAEAKAQAEAEAAKQAEEDAMMDRTIDEMTEEEIKAMEEKWGITFNR